MNFLEDYRPKVEDELRLVVRKGSTPLLGLNTLTHYHLGFADREGNSSNNSQGKYLRPLVCIAMCAGLGGDPEKAIPAAAALELVHRTTLIFDDIQDKGIERNNQPTVWSIWGADQAINAGLVLSCYARLALHRLPLRKVPARTVMRIQSVLENAVIDLCQGQYMDVSFVDSLSVGVEDYLRMVEGKTSSLFSAAIVIGAMLASSANPVLCTAWEFGLNIGMAFQIHDDYLGIWGDEATVGKTANDLIERKRSLPVVLALEQFPDQMVRWLKLPELTPDLVGSIRFWMENRGIPQQVKEAEARYIRKARANLEALHLQKEWQGQFEEVLPLIIINKS